jgi:DNA-binding transcriptional LysR family regulator
MTFPIPMNCELLDLRALVAVADGRSFMRAAQQLNLSQPALSRRIQKLEQAVGTVLVERTTRTVRLTAAGAQVVPLIRRMLQEIDGSLVGLMAQGERAAGRITLASIPSATVQFLPEVLQRFSLDYRNTRVRILDLSAGECAEAVRTGEAEFGLSLPVGSDSDLVYSPLYDDPYGLVCRKDDPLGAKADVGWADLVERRLVTVHSRQRQPHHVGGRAGRAGHQSELVLRSDPPDIGTGAGGCRAWAIGAAKAGLCGAGGGQSGVATIERPGYFPQHRPAAAAWRSIVARLRAAGQPAFAGMDAG